MPEFGGITNAAKSLSGNPLGIIALFVVFIYGFAALATAFTGSLTPWERGPLIGFLILFPIGVLSVFAWLVSRHPTNLYAPRDFRSEDNYVRTVALLAAASGRSAAETGQQTVDIGAIVTTVEQSPQFRGAQTSIRSRRLLWVDDRPENNVLEREAFENAGYPITLALSTHQSLEMLGTNTFAAIISDMGRKEGPREGYKLLETVRGQGNRTHFFIYAGSNLPDHRREALERGA